MATPKLLLYYVIFLHHTYPAQLVVLKLQRTKYTTSKTQEFCWQWKIFISSLKITVRKVFIASNLANFWKWNFRVRCHGISMSDFYTDTWVGWFICWEWNCTTLLVNTCLSTRISQDVIDSLFVHVEVLTCFLVLNITIYIFNYFHLSVYYVGILIYMFFVWVILLWMNILHIYIRRIYIPQQITFGQGVKIRSTRTRFRWYISGYTQCGITIPSSTKWKNMKHNQNP